MYYRHTQKLTVTISLLQSSCDVSIQYTLNVLILSPLHKGVLIPTNPLTKMSSVMYCDLSRYLSLMSHLTVMAMFLRQIGENFSRLSLKLSALNYICSSFITWPCRYYQHPRPHPKTMKDPFSWPIA